MVANQGKILIVDDNRMNRMKLSHSVEQQGYIVRLAENGQEALGLLRDEEFDVVLLDIIMPEMDGYQVLERIKGDPDLRDIPVIVISALDEIDSAVRCIEIGAEDYLPKPFNPVLLRARLNASLEKKKLRDLEKAYLQQEMMLRQNEKLATLGKLSAGMAHEMNNPAAATQRGAMHLKEAFSRLQEIYRKLGELHLTEDQQTGLLAIGELVQEKAIRTLDMDSLLRSDREIELEAWLIEQDVQNAWDVAPNLVNFGYEKSELISLLNSYSQSAVLVLLEWLNCNYIIFSLLEEISQGAKRISDIVSALKSYTYLDQAPIQSVNINDSLDNTLEVLKGKLKPSILVNRIYSEDLPEIEAYGSELNQVWTNIIDNAIDALNGGGEITLRTSYDYNWAVIEIEDNGPGIPESIQANLFDPFFSTKPPGQGTGLGLNIAHNIVVQKHNGRIDVNTQSGKTSFEVRLPLQLSSAD
jgi:signal transduction histidine kinase